MNDFDINIYFDFSKSLSVSKEYELESEYICK